MTYTEIRAFDGDKYYYGGVSCDGNVCDWHIQSAKNPKEYKEWEYKVEGIWKPLLTNSFF